MTPDPGDYCRHIESYLCQKNGGHLIRIVGPAFERVCGWAEGGVPLKIAFRGIDRCCERYYAKARRRRPVKIEFCEADVLELFDDWRRAIGIGSAPAGASPPPRKSSLASHIERVVTRLAALRAGSGRSRELDDRIAAAIEELDRMLPDARRARGDQRVALIQRLEVLDRELVGYAVAELDPRTTALLQREAASELTPFAGRMAGDAHAAAEETAFLRLARESVKLPLISFE